MRKKTATGTGTSTGGNRRRKAAVAGAAGALLASAVTVSVLQARRRRSTQPRDGATTPTPAAASGLIVGGSSIARWQALRSFRALPYLRATWADLRRAETTSGRSILKPLPANTAALASFAAARAANAFFREQDPATAQLWLTRHYDLRVREPVESTTGEATPLNLASAELNCWSALQAVADGAPIHLLHAPLAELDALLHDGPGGVSNASLTRAQQAAHALRTPGRR